METLDGTEWDVVISSTGLVPSLLALALSRSGKRILHLDRNDYYGGNEAALSLAEAEAWALQRSQQDENAVFSRAATTRREGEVGKEQTKLSPSRAYSLALAPQLIYARSALIDALVSSRAHTQLDFQAVGSWFVVERSASQTTAKRVPSGREDVFQDNSLDLKAKRSLMKFLRFVGTYEDQPEVWHDWKDHAFASFLEQKFALPPSSHELIMALTLSSEGRASTTTEHALPSMSRYLRSIGVLGPGFGSVMPKWGGLAEIAQVCCRACAVGGGVYVLKKSIKDIESNGEGTVVALYTVGCMFGSLACYGLGDRLGRIRTIAAGSILVIIGSILLSSSFSLAQLIVGRLVLGLGFGMLTATVPVWQSESSPAEHRGALVVLEGLFASVGLALSQAVDLGLYFASGSVSWRFPLAVPILFALIILAALPVMPDSPRWLVKKRRVEEARAVLAVLEDVPEDSSIIVEDVRKMQMSLSISETGKGDFGALLRNGQSRLLNRTLLAMFSTFSQQINGIGVIGFYTTTIFEELLGLSPITARGLSVAIYVWQVSNTLVTFYTIDRIGRRKLMMFGNLGMGTMFIIVAGTVSQADRSEACAIVAAICVFLITTFFGIGALGINYLYGTEVAPLSHRVPIYALTSGTLWIFNFLVVEITPVGFSNLGYKFFIVFAVIDICLLFPVVYFFLPETRRRSLEDIDLIFSQAKNAFDVVRIAKSLPVNQAVVVDAHNAREKNASNGLDRALDKRPA